MGIARALRRVKRQAKRGGLGALRAGLGDELRSGAIPGPLRGAARRIAAFIDPRSGRASAHKPGTTATPAVAPAPADTLRHAPPEQANKLGSDRGDAPNVEPEAPADNVAVDPIAVGATPVYDATPIEVAPVDATPSDVVNDVTPVVVPTSASAPEADEPASASDEGANADDEPASDARARAHGAEAAPSVASDADLEPSAVSEPEPASDELASDELASKAKPKPKKRAPAASKKKPSAAATPEKEKLAAASEEAKSAARSAPKAKRSGGQGGRTSKKK